MTYNYGRQIRVCSKVSYILRENNDAGDLFSSLQIGKKKKADFSKASHETEKHAAGSEGTMSVHVRGQVFVVLKPHLQVNNGQLNKFVLANDCFLQEFIFRIQKWI